ncbi:glutaminyl-peptide cyclotransferase-like [Babylonia areolata]|uniref:glutaminyl-peptide cyclotransferase-like n=1 Tax=Babylonia areolata TaxID=304850 RepID=UPI003FD40AD5
MKTATTTTTICVKLLTLCWTAVPLVAQQTPGCGSLASTFTLDNLHNVSVGMSIDVLRKSALPPLLAVPRVPDTPGSLFARSHITKWMTAAGWSVEEDTFLDSTPLYGHRRFTNVVATLNPNRSRRVVVACHYDSKLMPGPQAFVGATDSAVPCALMLDSALQLRHFLVERENPTAASSGLTVQFIFFDGEEAFVQWRPTDSLYGSRHLAQRWADLTDPVWPKLNHLQTIEVFILLDLIGTSDTQFRNRFPQTTGVYNKLRNIEICLKNKGYLTTTQNPQPLFTSQQDYNVVEDDHIPFWQRGVPVVHLITVPFPGVWHTPLDTESVLDFPRVDNLARVLRVFLTDLPL